MSVIALIPARMASSRFPGKPLARLLGLPMIEHVYRRTRMSDAVDGVYVATCDPEIRDVVHGFGGTAIMTAPTHDRGTDRIAEAAATLGLGERDIVVNVQGDEPMIDPRMLALAVDPLHDDAAIECTNLISPIVSDDEFTDTDTIKVARSADAFAMYMSRAAIPSNTRGITGVVAWKQVCVIGFRYGLLQRFCALPQTPLERTESIDMLRLMENGVRVRLIESPYDTLAVDTPAGLARAAALLAEDPIARALTRGSPDAGS